MLPRVDTRRGTRCEHRVRSRRSLADGADPRGCASRRPSDGIARDGNCVGRSKVTVSQRFPRCGYLASMRHCDVLRAPTASAGRGSPAVDGGDASAGGWDWFCASQRTHPRLNGSRRDVRAKDGGASRLLATPREAKVATVRRSVRFQPGRAICPAPPTGNGACSRGASWFGCLAVESGMFG